MRTVENNRPYPSGLCESCAWKFQCGYAAEHPGEHVRTCDEDGGLSYTPEQVPDAEKPELKEPDCVRARIRKPSDGGIPYIEIKRAKYKHWHMIGTHYESDLAFRRALSAGTVVWLPKIVESSILFEK